MMTKSCLRVFLSADLVGSTKLKNRLNHQELLDKYQSRLHVIEKLRVQNSKIEISSEEEQAAVLESLGVSTEDFDWASVVYNFYQDIHAKFTSSPELKGLKPELWKTEGDELIYAVVCPGRAELHRVVIAFLQAVREVDNKLRNAHGETCSALRVKGAAWVAGFPVRNRDIELPSKRKDFLGPDMDTGFRISKCTRSGMLVASVELAELLGECQGKYAPMLGKIVGWEELKGVWNDQRYPVIWIDFPDSHPEAEAHKAVPFNPWDQEECSWCKTWENSSAKIQLSSLAKTLVGLRQALPKSLGLVNPYIVDDPLETNGISQEHKDILKLLEAIGTHRKTVSCQDAKEEERKRPLPKDVEDVKQYVSRSPSKRPRKYRKA